MSMSSIPSSSQSGKLYGWVERIGNKVPHPFLLFIYLIIVLMVTTAILSAFGVSAKNPTDGTPVVVKNLLSVEGLHWFLPNVIKNFSGFAPLGAILARRVPLVRQTDRIPSASSYLAIGLLAETAP